MLEFLNGTLVLERSLLPDGLLRVENDRIVALGKRNEFHRISGTTRIDLEGGYLVPGFIDLHVHGGDGADFMDGTLEAFEAICQCHLRHGTTALTPTSTVAPESLIMRFLETNAKAMDTDRLSSQVLGAHLYGPYFNPDAKGCHPSEGLRHPTELETAKLLEFSEAIASATVAPELPGAESFVRAMREEKIVCNVGHSYATFEQMEQAVRWGVRHVDHLYCAMSDRARLRQSQTFPMRGGVMEASLYFDELTTEIIADGKHLSPELMKLAHKIKGPDRLAIVTDANRAVDCPDGSYWFGPVGCGEEIIRRDQVGLMPNGSALASGVMGLDHAVRTLHRLGTIPLPELIRMVTLTPARILQLDHERGSLKSGKRADLVILDSALQVKAAYVGGECRFQA